MKWGKFPIHRAARDADELARNCRLQSDVVDEPTSSLDTVVGSCFGSGELPIDLTMPAEIRIQWNSRTRSIGTIVQCGMSMIVGEPSVRYQVAVGFHSGSVRTPRPNRPRRQSRLRVGHGSKQRADAESCEMHFKQLIT